MECGAKCHTLFGRIVSHYNGWNVHNNAIYVHNIHIIRNSVVFHLVVFVLLVYKHRTAVLLRFARTTSLFGPKFNCNVVWTEMSGYRHRFVGKLLLLLLLLLAHSCCCLHAFVVRM